VAPRHPRAALRETVREEADPAWAPGAALAHGGVEHGGVQPCLEDPVCVAAMEATRTGGRRGRPGQPELPLGLLVLRAQRGDVWEASGVAAARARPCVRTAMTSRRGCPGTGTVPPCT
jgi:hypothetical protein